MKKELKILLIDDHPMIIEAYINILKNFKELSRKYDFIIDTATDCDIALKKIENSIKNKGYDIVFSDIKLPPSQKGEIISGEDLTIYTKKVLPDAKIVILTMFNENYRIHNILKNVNPDGFLIKNDVTSKEFLIAFEKIIEDPPYYSTTVTKYFRKQTLMGNKSLLDDTNRKILYYLSQGVKTKNLHKHINLSQSALEKRKNHIKNLFELEKANDEELIREANVRGFI